MYELKLVPFNEIFDLKRGNIISKEDIVNNTGDYPVYSTQIDDLFGSINSYMYHGKYLIWNTDGLAGYIRVTEGKFSITNIVGIMIFKKDFQYENISLEYLKEYLQPIFRANKKGRIGENGKNEYTKLNSTMIKQLNIRIPIPIKSDGTFDLEKQDEIANKYKKINQKKLLLKEKRHEIEGFDIEELGEYKFKEIKFTDDKIGMFMGKSLGMPMKLLKIYEQNDGIPVYTANRDYVIKVSEILNKPIIHADEEKPILSYAKDGDGTAGTNIIIHRSDFYIGSHREAIKINYNNIDIEYLYWQIIDMKHKYEFNQAHPATQNNMSKVKIRVPINDNGEFDLEAQKEIAQKYNKLNRFKKIICERLDLLINQDINIQ